MVEQQLYTRSSNGFFLNKPGYDTVRLSKGIDLSVAQDNNHVFLYKGNDINGVSENIPVISRFMLNNGDLMLNCSNPYSYVSYDGIKETFISHSYIIKTFDEQFEQQAKDVRQIAGVLDFIKTHIDGSNEPLEQLTELPFEKIFPQIEYVKFALKKFSSSFFSKIVYATICSALTSKKMYIIPESITEIQDILDILKAIYFFIPICLRNRIGYITSLNNQEIPKGVNIAFVSPTYMTEIKSKNLFGNYIADDFCFDLRSEETIFNGNIDFPKETEFMSLIQNIFSYPNEIEGIVGYFDKQLENDVTFERIEILSRFVNVLDKKNTELIQNIENYKNIRSAFKSDFSLPYLKKYISNLVEKSNNDLNCDELNAVAILYKYVPEDYQDTIINYIINSIDCSCKDLDNFYKKMDVCSKFDRIEGYVISKLIASENEKFITNYYNREFSKYHTVTELFNKLFEYENNPILADDSLLSKTAFINTVLDKIDLLFDRKFELSFINEVYTLSHSVKNKKLRSSIINKVKEYISKFIRKHDVYSIQVNDLELIFRNYSAYIDDEFVESANIILKCFNTIGDDLDKYTINDYFNSFDDKIIPISNYFKKYFSNEEINRHYFAYTIAYFDPISKSLSLKAAFDNIKSVYDIVHYTKWLNRKFDYTGRINCLYGSTGEKIPEEKYKDLANSILHSLSIIDDDISSKEANSYINELKDYMNPRYDTQEEMFSDFCKLVKKAMSGKPVEKIRYRNYSNKQKQASKSDKKLIKGLIDLNIEDNVKKLIIIGITCLIIAAVIIGSVFGPTYLNKVKKGNDTPNTTVEEDTTIVDNWAKLYNKDKTIADIPSVDVLSSVKIALEQVDADSIDEIQDADEDKFIKAFNKALSDKKIIKEGQQFDFDSVSKQFETVYNKYSEDFIKSVTNNKDININEIYTSVFDKYGIEKINDLSNDKKQDFITDIEKELANFVPNLPKISKDLNTYYALEILSDLYENSNTPTVKEDKTIADIPSVDVLSSVKIALEQVDADSIDEVRDADEDKFIKAFNKTLSDKKIIKKGQQFKFDSVSKQFETVYNKYSEDFIKSVTNNKDINIKKIYKRVLKNYGVKSINDLSNDKKQDFITDIEKELKEYAEDLPNISEDLNTYYALEILSNIYENPNESNKLIERIRQFWRK